jgi:hypothetical protein
LVDRPHMRWPDPDGFVCLLGCKGRVADGGGEAVKVPRNMRLTKDKDGKPRLIRITDPRLDASAKIRQRKSKNQRVVRRGTV